MLVYLHGGGWTTGGITVSDRPCRSLAVAADCVVASVEFRLSPETRYPGPLEDVLSGQVLLYPRWRLPPCCVLPIPTRAPAPG